MEQLRDCILEADEVFGLEPSEHRIDTAESKPVQQPPRRIPFVLRPEVRRMIDDLLQTGVIQESSSPWASPVVLVRKRDQTLRFCVDYRQLKAVTRNYIFPLPRVEDLLYRLHGKCV